MKLIEILVRQHLDVVIIGAIFEVGVGLVGDDLAIFQSRDTALARSPRSARSARCVLSLPVVFDRQTAARPNCSRRTCRDWPSGPAVRPDCGSGRSSSSGCCTSNPLRDRISHQLRDAVRVGRRRRCSIHRFLEPRIGDQLHRPRDLADVLDRTAAFIECASFGHGIPVFGLRGGCCHRFWLVTCFEFVDRGVQLWR